MRLAFAFLFIGLVAACGRGVPEGARLVVAGDSVMAWNRTQDASVARNLSRLLGQPVGDVSLPFASVTGSTGRGALNITEQVSDLSPRWVVMNGGANDLRVGCSGPDTRGTLDTLVSEDGRSGAIPRMVSGLRARGSNVLWADYYTSPRFAGTTCGRIYDEMAARTERMAAADPGIVFVDMGDVVPFSNGALFARDQIHPSVEGSARIARQIAEALRAADPALTR